MLLDQRGHERAVGREGANRARLILAHQAAIALHIGTEDRRQLPDDLSLLLSFSVGGSVSGGTGSDLGGC